ncbi:MAG: Ppx/GppA family phosphatase [Xanthomonadales bacterium]|nr:Ppx/GppA family phosphatase [Xanthomonadales bacterium]MCE7930910.1 Ppx/GppA family phosphatase [Xanthomonadales bacterium PRO6]
MIVARFTDGGLQVIDRLRDPVRMALGLTADGQLTPEIRERALASLARFGQRLRGIARGRIRAIATNTVRQLRNPRAFLLPAQTALGAPIEVVSGREEARLIYLGVAHGLNDPRQRQLVIDVGGGSTELIIGQGFEPLETESLQMGCVATTQRFFADGRITRKRWQEVQLRLPIEFAPIVTAYKTRGWKRTIGSSGTIKAISDILCGLGGREREIARAGLLELIDRLIEVGDIQHAHLPGLSEDRRPVFLGGLAALWACFEALDLHTMRVSDYAMREGLLYDSLGRLQQQDPRERSIRALARRYSVDGAQALRVQHTALKLFDQARGGWKLEDDARETLLYATMVHEIGLAVSHSQHHKHGAYIIEHSDLPGFSRQEQEAVAALVRGHRRSIPEQTFAEISPRELEGMKRTLALFRLAAVLHRSRSEEALPPLALEVAGREMRLTFPRGWLSQQPLTWADLRQEKDFLEPLGLRLRLRIEREGAAPLANRFVSAG